MTVILGDHDASAAKPARLAPQDSPPTLADCPKKCTMSAHHRAAVDHASSGVPNLLSCTCGCSHSSHASQLHAGLSHIKSCCCAQGCTNVLWGLARQDAKRMQLITGKGHLFKVMAWRLVQQAERLLPNEGLPVNFSMLIWSLGTLNYNPGMPPLSSCLQSLSRESECSRELGASFE